MQRLRPLAVSPDWRSADANRQSRRQKRRRTCERRDERADTEPERVRSPDPQDEVRSQARDHELCILQRIEPQRA